MVHHRHEPPHNERLLLPSAVGGVTLNASEHRMNVDGPDPVVGFVEADVMLLQGIGDEEQLVFAGRGRAVCVLDPGPAGHARRSDRSAATGVTAEMRLAAPRSRTWEGGREKAERARRSG
jgi:hypothetical protein